MQAYISSNIGLVVILLFSIIMIQSILIFITMRRIKTLSSISSWLLLFERFIFVVFKTEIEEFINKKNKEVAEEVLKHKQKQNLYEMHKNNVASSPITSSGRW